MPPKTTDKKKFRLRDRSLDRRLDHDEEIFYTDLLWFELMEGEKRGLQFPIPKNHPEYDDNVSSTLSDIEEGDLVKMSCVSMNKKNTAWRCKSIDII